MPRTREYEDNAARQRAYRKRLKQKRLNAQGLPLDAQVGKVSHETTVEHEALDRLLGKGQS